MDTLGHPFTVLDSTESTNIHAMAMAHARLAGHGTAYFAHEQTAGRGQRGKSWISEPGENIILSVVLQPEGMNPSDPFPLHALTALACFDLFNKYAGDETAIKWPNDLYWRDRKSGGILIESALSGEKIRHAVVGIGININQVDFPADLPNPVSLRQITGKRHDAESLARELCHHLEYRYRQFGEEGFEKLLQEYNGHLFARGKTVQLKTGPEVRRVHVYGVDGQGRLLVGIDGQQALAFGNVEWQPGSVQ
jgi:BirA family biotin operon repressor/biotin-[acetyl-CoA-carboxylase] ligase